MNLLPLYVLFGDSIFAAIPGGVLYPYVAGLAILAFSIYPCAREIARMRRPARILPLGSVLFAVSMAVFGSQHFTEAATVATLVPSWIPWHLFWTYFVGVALIAASVSIALKKYSRWAAMLLAVLLIVFELLLHIPRIVGNPKDLIGWALALRDLAFCGGALALAATRSGKPKAVSTIRLSLIARYLLALPTLFFAAVHIFRPELLPGVDLDTEMPLWLPGSIFWGYFAGNIFLVTAACLILNKKTRYAAICLSITAFLLVLFVFLPMLAAKPSDIDNGLDFLVSTLAFSGAALLLAKAMPPVVPSIRRNTFFSRLSAWILNR